MFVDALSLEPDITVDTDICIVGAGAAGLTLALELNRGSQSVCLMEAGGLDATDESQSLYAGENVGLNYTPLEAARIRYFGGTTNHWSGWCWPLDELDFEKRDWVPDSGWPITKADLDAYYARAQAFCELGEQSFALSEWSSTTQPALAVDGLESRVLKFSAPTRFGLTYRDDIAQSESITSYLNAGLIRLKTNAAGTAVTEGLFQSGLSSKRFKVRAKQFVLAAGGIENAKLLLQSRDVSANGIGNDRDLVGRYFADHPGHASGMILFTEPEKNLDLYKYHRSQPTLKEKIDDGGSMSGFFADEKDRQAMLDWIDSGADVDTYHREIEPIVKQSCLHCHNAAGIAFFRNFENISGIRRLALRPENENLSGVGYSAGIVLSKAQQEREGICNARTMLADRGSWGDLFEGEDMLDSIGTVLDNFGDLTRATYNRVMDNPRRTLVVMRTAIETVPNRDSRVTLTDELDAYGQPKVRLDWRLSDMDKQTFLQTESAIGRALGASGQGRLLQPSDLENADWGNGLNHGWHHMGTTRMHDSPEFGVVDKDCKIHGVDNLYIAGSSVFPTYGYANPTLTIVALAVRLADKLKESAI